ncbi:MAG: hypothetical protein PUG55_00110 [Bacillales bacterium]|nr:hypothetical protein [Bacillales bacterium]
MNKYQQIINKLKDTKNNDELFILLNAYINEKLYEDAIKLIENNSQLVKEKPLHIIKLHIELLLSLELFDEASIAYKKYLELPYISQEVEEYLKEIPSLIEERKDVNKNKTYTIDEIDEILTSHYDQGKIMDVLFSLDNYNILKLLTPIEIFLLRKDVHPSLRTYALISLVSNNISSPVQILKDGKKITVVPNKLKPPFCDDNFKKVIKYIESELYKDPSVQQIAFQLLNNYVLDCYPDDVLNDVDLNEFCLALTSLAKDYLSIANDDVTNDQLKQKIKKVLEKTPDLII